MSDIKDLSQSAIDELKNGIIPHLGSIARGEKVILKWNVGLQKDEPQDRAGIKDRIAAAAVLKALACEESANDAIRNLARTFLVRYPVELKVAND